MVLYGIVWLCLSLVYFAAIAPIPSSLVRFLWFGMILYGSALFCIFLSSFVLFRFVLYSFVLFCMVLLY